MRSFQLCWPGVDVIVEFGTRTRVDLRYRWGARWLVVRDDDAPPAALASGTFDVRATGLWLSLVCETPGEHWTVGLETFALAVDDPDDERGELVPLGFDIEWEAPGTVHGEVLVADQVLALDESASLTTT